eukprot:scaffold185478_cov18-Tisochrysis_lutea.AAC.1
MSLARNEAKPREQKQLSKRDIVLDVPKSSMASEPGALGNIICLPPSLVLNAVATQEDCIKAECDNTFTY